MKIKVTRVMPPGFESSPIELELDADGGVVQLPELESKQEGWKIYVPLHGHAEPHYLWQTIGVGSLVGESREVEVSYLDSDLSPQLAPKAQMTIADVITKLREVQEREGDLLVSVGDVGGNDAPLTEITVEQEVPEDEWTNPKPKRVVIWEP